MLLLVFLTGMLLGAHGYNHFAPVKSFHDNDRAVQLYAGTGERPEADEYVSLGADTAFEQPSFQAVNASTHPGRSERKEKRHGKSLITEAIVAEELPVVQPEFTWFERHYSRYLPGGCCQQTFGNFSLRGPPVLG